jgi:hypothetical protein
VLRKRNNEGRAEEVSEPANPEAAMGQEIPTPATLSNQRLVWFSAHVTLAWRSNGRLPTSVIGEDVLHHAQSRGDFVLADHKGW